MEQVASINSLFGQYTLCRFNVNVSSQETRTETNFTTVTQHQRHGSTTSVNARNTDIQTIHIKDDQGQPKALKLIDLVIPCETGHQLTLYGLDQNHWFKGTNLTTDQSYQNLSLISSYVFPQRLIKWSLYLFILLGLIVAWSLSQGSIEWFIVGAVSALIVAALLSGMVHLFIGIPIAWYRKHQILSCL